MAVIMRYYTERVGFLQRVLIARNADRCNSYGLAVCLSVRPSRSDVLSRRMMIRSCGFQHPAV